MGDYHRYLAEFALGDKRKGRADKSLDAYKAVLNSPDRACHLAKQVFDDAIGELLCIGHCHVIPSPPLVEGCGLIFESRW
jgi:hypothetical protein